MPSAATAQWIILIQSAGLSSVQRRKHRISFHIKAKALQNYVEGSFKVKELRNFPVEANFRAKVRLEDIYSIYPLEGITLKGDLFANLKMNGTYDPKRKLIPKTNVVLNLNNGYIKLAEYPNLPIENIKVETHINSTN